VVHTAAKLVLEPILEAGFADSAYGYRPGRSALDAVQAVYAALCEGYTEVVEADLSKYFDTIPHAELLQGVARRVVDRHMRRLVTMWLKVPVEARDGEGRRRLSGGKLKRSTRGTPQGGVMSPLLANILPASLSPRVAAARQGAGAPRAGHLVLRTISSS
jgi:RNA-directed DNA polymerase